MKRIFVNGILSISIPWILFYLLNFIWSGELYNICFAFFCLLFPIGYIYSLINGFIKAKRFKILKIDYNVSIPCYVFLGLYEIQHEEWKEIKNTDTLKYSLCLCSKEMLYFYQCDRSLMNLSKYDYKICDDINSAIVSIEKNNILKFSYTDLERDQSNKIAEWVTNKISEHIQGYFTNRIRKIVKMDAIVEIYYIASDTTIRVLTFGIPETLIASTSIDFTSILPNFIDDTYTYISECNEIFSFFDEDPLYIKKAKKMIQSLFYQTIN